MRKRVAREYLVDELTKVHGHTVLRLPPYHCILNPIEMLWSYQKRLVRSQSTVRTAKEALTLCKERFQQIPGADLRPYFAHAFHEEERFWGLDGSTESVHPPVIIPVYDSETDDSNENGAGDEDDNNDDSDDEIEF